MLSYEEIEAVSVKIGKYFKVIHESTIKTHALR